jgi:hypothetical protein
VVEAGLEDGIDMPAVQAEDLPNTRLLEHPHKHFAAVYLRHLVVPFVVAA